MNQPVMPLAAIPTPPTPEVVIQVEQVSKRYSRNERHQHSLRHDAAYLIKRLLKNQHSAQEVKPFYALYDVNFSIERGEAVALIGRNGSGKTTLLRVLAGITRATGGQVMVKGRHAALIALGAGFKPELTGRKNIYLNAAIHGVRPREVDAMLNDIIEFSELGEFIDIPINRYSSGMAARLGFSIAIHSAPDILFVDEVLAVGDAPFQEKCMQRITAMRKQMQTLVFVSHSETTVRNLCERAIWLHKGHIMADGPTEHVYQAYKALA